MRIWRSNGAHSRDELATLLWPASGHDSLVYGQDTVGFAPDSLIVDVDEFRALSAGCSSHAPSDVCAKCVADVERATEVYRDELLVMYSLNWSFASSGGKFSGEPPFAELDEALRLSQKTGDLWSCAHIQNGLGDLYRETGNPSAALAAYEDSLAQMEVLNDRWMMAWNYEGLAATACREGRLKAGAREYCRALEFFTQLGDKGDALYILEQVVGVLVDLEKLADIPAILAALLTLHGHVDARTFDSSDEPVESIDGGDGAWTVPDDLKEPVRHCRETYPVEWISGRTTSLERIVSMRKTVVSPSRDAGREE